MSRRIVGEYRWAAPGSWLIEAEPDVMIKLKRIFPRVNSTRAGGIVLTATPETGRDLAWALERWPMSASKPDQRRLARDAAEHKRTEERVQDVLGGGLLARGGDWAEPALALRDYQIQARDLVRASGAALIADELGLGKTAMALALLEDPEARPALAVVLTGLTRQWLRQLAKFYPTLTGVEITTGKPHALEVDGKTPDLIVINYAKLAKWQHHLKGVARTVIFDECQEIRRSDSDKYRAAATIASKADKLIGLSATPVYNHGGELFNILDVLKPGALGSREEFAREWCKASYGMDQKTPVAEPAALRSHLVAHGLFLRRTRPEVGIDLPGVSTMEQHVPSDTTMLRKLEGNAAEMARLILEQSAKRPSGHWQAFGQFDFQMRQITGICKAPFVADFVRLLLESEEKVVLFGWHRAVYDIWLERLRDFAPLLYTGTESPRAKDAAVQKFLNGECRVLIMSLVSGAGLDGLQEKASTIVFGELDWSPGRHKQAIGRLHRPGQENRTLAYFCTTDDGADPPMLDVLNIKTMEIDPLIEPENVEEADHVAHNDRIRQLARAVLERSGRHTQTGPDDQLMLPTGT